VTLWDGYDAVAFYAVRNGEGQYSVWPQHRELPVGWDPVAGPAPRAQCLAEIEARWTDMRPASVVAGPRGPDGRGSDGRAASGSRAVTPVSPRPGMSVLTGPVAPRAAVPIHRLIETAAGIPGSSIAMRCGGVTCTRTELFETCRAWAAVLAGEGCGPEVPVAVLIPRGVEALTAILAILRTGAAYVPLSCADPADRLAAILQDCGPPLVVAADDTVDLLLSYPGRVLRLSELRERAARSGSAPDGPAPALMADSLAFIIYTSGTTGQPKGVQGTHGQLTNYALWCRSAFPHHAEEWTVLHAPLSFLGSLTCIFTPLLAGWPIEIAPEGATVDDLIDLIASLPVGLLKLTPTHVRMMLARGADKRRSARQFMIGSEPLVVSADFAEWIRREPAAIFANHYGLTETHGCFCHWFGADVLPGESVPIGVPISNVRAHIVDEDGEDRPAGTIGELLIAGESIGRGYHAKPALTAERWIPDRHGAPGSRVLRTGDLARLRPDGTVEVVGRADRQVKVRGHRVEPGAVEHVLRSLPGVAEALVLPRSYDGATTMVAYLVPRPGAILDLRAIHRTASALLPLPSLPSRMAVLSQFPVNANGKLHVGALPEAGPMVAGHDTGAAGEGTEASSGWTSHELIVADVFRSALGLEAMGLDDDFFDLGGDSLTAVAVAVAVGGRLGRDDIPAATPDCSSVRAYARVVAEAALEPADAP